MSTAVLSAPALQLDRKALRAALRHIALAAKNRSPKPILQCVKLSASKGQLTLAATDGDCTLTRTLSVNGDLPLCVVSCCDLLQRIDSGRTDHVCLRLDEDGETLVLNGGRIEHRLPIFPTPDFPVIDTELKGEKLFLDAGVLRDALRVTLCAAARETTRYAINGMLLESDHDDVRLVATDGRRMAVVDLLNRTDAYRGQVILPVRAVQLLIKLIGKNDDACITVAVDTPETKKDAKNGSSSAVDDMASQRTCIAGDDWAMSFQSIEGRFPHYRDVMPKSGSRFAADRRELLDTLEAVATATNLESRAVRLELSHDAIGLSARAPQAGEARGSVDAEFLGGDDEFVITGFNPGFLRDAVQSLSDDRVVIDVQQNQLSKGTGSVFGHPALIYGEASPRARWVLMPVNLGLEASRENLGGNYREEIEESSSTRKRKSA